jgi:hypothetical protein
VNQVKLHTTQLHIAPGDVLLAYTDGIIERRGPHGPYGAHRLMTAASATYPLPAAQLSPPCAPPSRTSPPKNPKTTSPCLPSGPPNRDNCFLPAYLCYARGLCVLATDR